MASAVTAGAEPVLVVTVVNLPGIREERIEVVVDTGFTGHLTWRPEIVERLSLPVVGSAETILADGSTVIEDFCLARVLWHETPRSVRALVADTVPPLGMSLLRGSELRIVAEPGGEVILRRLP